jgi:hypothetical protein
MTFPCPAFVVIDSWAGRGRYRVTIVGETKTRFRVEWRDKDLPRGKGGWFATGQWYLVPKTAVVIGDPGARL